MAARSRAKQTFAAAWAHVEVVNMLRRLLVCIALQASWSRQEESPRFTREHTLKILERSGRERAIREAVEFSRSLQERSRWEELVDHLQKHVYDWAEESASSEDSVLDSGPEHGIGDEEDDDYVRPDADDYSTFSNDLQ